jgi:hypothetical protein
MSSLFLIFLLIGLLAALGSLSGPKTNESSFGPKVLI